uniref:Uncharacterized protein n=1 Tax=Fagus sylvatica TaxID=28930 RepID=A0A2N9H917_FAGSY
MGQMVDNVLGRLLEVMINTLGWNEKESTTHFEDGVDFHSNSCECDAWESRCPRMSNPEGEEGIHNLRCHHKARKFLSRLKFFWGFLLPAWWFGGGLGLPAWSFGFSVEVDSVVAWRSGLLAWRSGLVAWRSGLVAWRSGLVALDLGWWLGDRGWWLAWWRSGLVVGFLAIWSSFLFRRGGGGVRWLGDLG